MNQNPYKSPAPSPRDPDGPQEAAWDWFYSFSVFLTIAFCLAILATILWTWNTP